MCLVNFCPCRRTQTLHSIIARAEQQRVENIGTEVEYCGYALHSRTGPFVYCRDSAFYSILSLDPYKYSNIKDKSKNGDSDASCNFTSPTMEVRILFRRIYPAKCKIYGHRGIAKLPPIVKEKSV